MSPTLTPELYWLTLTLLMTGLFWVPYLLERISAQGLLNALWDPQGTTHTDTAWAQRMMRAHRNAVENLVIFAPLVLAVQITGKGTTLTAIACVVYFGARAVHYVVYTLAVPVLRVPTFVAGFLAQMTLALTLIGVV